MLEAGEVAEKEEANKVGKGRKGSGDKEEKIPCRGGPENKSLALQGRMGM